MCLFWQQKVILMTKPATIRERAITDLYQILLSKTISALSTWDVPSALVVQTINSASKKLGQESPEIFKFSLNDLPKQ
ncbi:hypothetical protein Leryth_007728 [Lithospermum erythrorhizon]|nr:hypothetical protein Leryth_007728 [Lithospermum erythrorhizon]